MPHETYPSQFADIASILIDASEKSKIAVKVNSVKELNNPHPVNVNITFFKDNDSFTIFLYDFWSEKKNNELAEIAIELMNDPSKYEEVKEQLKVKQ